MAFFDGVGRIGVTRFLVAIVFTLVALLGWIASLFYLPAWTNPLSCAIVALALLALGCEAARRLHDLGITAWVLALVGPALAFVGLAILLLYWVGAVAWLIGGGVIAAAALLFLRPGDPAANRFGAPPQQALGLGVGPGGPSRLRAILTLGLALAVGLGGGFLLYALDQGMRAKAGRSARMVMVDPSVVPAARQQ